MLFNSYTFIIFFLVVLGLSRVLVNWTARKTMLLLVSYLFYAAWNPPFVILLWISTVVDWYLARGIYRSENQGRRRLLVILSLMVNLGLLGFFKYAYFFAENMQGIMGAAGLSWEYSLPSIVLPVGISFYTFQTLSYTLDVYRRSNPPWDSFLDYALYVTFFPQLVAGPIVRAFDFLPQCIEPAKVTARQFGWGLALMLTGLFNKIVVADGMLAPVVEDVYDAAGLPDFAAAWCSTFAFAGQIFCDFAGYSTIAIGVGLCLGFHLPTNFRFPYAAIGFSDFWRRWHVSLSSWLRDYLYISLGGNRIGPRRTYVNLMLTMLLGGLWHGAAWTFVAWGGLHGAYLVVERLLHRHVKVGSWISKTPVQFLLGFMTFLLVCFTWVFFRADSFDRAWGIIRAMLGGAQGELLSLAPLKSLVVLAVTAVMLALHWLMRGTTYEDAVARIPPWLRGVIMAGMILALFGLSGEDRAFIYFQF